jgi:hypothetical protein
MITVFMSNKEQTTQDLHNTLEAYYKVARKRFIDAVCLQAVDYFLVSNKSGPLWLFLLHFVGSLSNSDLSQIVGESDEAALRRVRLEEEIITLKAGEIILVG